MLGTGGSISADDVTIVASRLFDHSVRAVYSLDKIDETDKGASSH